MFALTGECPKLWRLIHVMFFHFSFFECNGNADVKLVWKIFIDLEILHSPVPFPEALLHNIGFCGIATMEFRGWFAKVNLLTILRHTVSRNEHFHFQGKLTDETKAGV